MFVDAQALNGLIGATVRRLREERGLSLREVEQIAGVHAAQLARLETGQSNWMPHHLQAVAQAFGLHPRDLLPDNPTPPLPEGERQLLQAVRARDWQRAITMLGEIAAEGEKP